MPGFEMMTNFNDMSDDTAFQFEFYCQHCNKTIRTEPQRYYGGAAKSLLDTAGSFLGGLFGGVSEIAEKISGTGYKESHEKAVLEAVSKMRPSFTKCRKCSSMVCSACFNANLKLCVSCAPSVEDEANAAAREAEIEVAREKAASEVKSGGRKTDGNIHCAACGARVKPSKFCSECGEKMARKSSCKECEAEIEEGVKFCPECGSKQ